MSSLSDVKIEGDAGANTVDAFKELVTTNPWGTLKNVGYAAYHYDQTWDAIVADYEKKAGTTRGRGEIAGDVLFTIFTGGVTKSVRETARVSKFANRIRKANKLVDASPSRRILDNPFGMTDDFRLGKGGNAPPDIPTHKHHSDPKFMGGDPKQPFTEVPIPEHKQLHKELNDFLHGKTDDVGNHMRPQRGNSGAKIRENFTLAERQEAMAEFYKDFQDTYADAARDFFKQHPHLE